MKGAQRRLLDGARNTVTDVSPGKPMVGKSKPLTDSVQLPLVNVFLEAFPELNSKLSVRLI
jgi:hypothetical protein